MVGTFTRSFLRFFTSSLRVRHFVSADQCVRLYGAALAKFKLFDVQVKRFSHRVISLFCISDVLYISPQKWSTLRDFRTNVSITDIEREIKKKKHKEKIKWFYSFYSRPPVLSLALVIGQEAVLLFYFKDDCLNFFHGVKSPFVSFYDHVLHYFLTVTTSFNNQ